MKQHVESWLFKIGIGLMMALTVAVIGSLI